MELILQQKKCKRDIILHPAYALLSTLFLNPTAIYLEFSEKQVKLVGELE